MFLLQIRVSVSDTCWVSDLAMLEIKEHKDTIRNLDMVTSMDTVFELIFSTKVLLKIDTKYLKYKKCN